MHSAIVLFALCDNMKWNHLPCAGGLYDQDPDLMDKFSVLFNLRNQHQAEEQQRQQEEMKNRTGRGGGGIKRPAGRRR